MKKLFVALTVILILTASAALLIVAASRRQFARPGIAIKWGSAGLTSLKANDQEFIADGEFRVHKVLIGPEPGKTREASLKASVSTDPASGTLTQTYEWGTVRAVYVPGKGKLAITVTTENRSSEPIQGLFYQPLTLKFPSKVAEYDGKTPLVESNLAGPTLIAMSYDSGVMVYANDDPSRPLMSGFPWALDRPESTVFPVEINTGRQAMYPDFFPYIDRPIPPGGSDVYRFSLRFGGKGVAIDNLTADVKQSFSALFPKKVQWPDRRPIGMIALSTAGTGFVSNPRGYFNDPNTDVTSGAGVEAFKTRLLALADRSVRILQVMNGQGVMVWDIEGQEFANASYVGDPKQFAAASPEMADVADEFIRRFRDAGLKVGVCIRPQEFQLDRGRQKARQVTVSDPARTLAEKIQFARQRWGASMFYIDSNGGPADPIPASIFRELLEQFPDILLIPEHKNVVYHAYSAPYRELRQGFSSTPADIRQKNPGFFSVINTSDGPIQQRFSDLVSAVRQGDILMFRTWFDDEPANGKIREAYRIARVKQQ